MRNLEKRRGLKSQRESPKGSAPGRLESGETSCGGWDLAWDWALVWALDWGVGMDGRRWKIDRRQSRKSRLALESLESLRKRAKRYVAGAVGAADLESVGPGKDQEVADR